MLPWILTLTPRFSFTETIWGPFPLSSGQGVLWSSEAVSKTVSEQMLPSRRRKSSFANNYDIAIIVTPTSVPVATPPMAHLEIEKGEPVLWNKLFGAKYG